MPNTPTAVSFDCPECDAKAEDEQITIMEHLVAYHPIVRIEGGTLYYVPGEPRHTYWETRCRSSGGIIVFEAYCLRCEVHWPLPEGVRRAEADEGE